MRSFVRTVVVTTVFAAVAMLTACEIDGTSNASGSTESVGTEFTLSLQDMEFVPAGIEVPAGESLTVELVNDGNARHDLLLEPADGVTGYHSPVLDPGGSATVQIGPFEPGTYEAVCTIPGHMQAGMVLEIDAR